MIPLFPPTKFTDRFVGRIFTHIDVDEKDKSLLAVDDPEGEVTPTQDVDSVEPMIADMQNESYSPNFADKSSPVHKKNDPKEDQVRSTGPAPSLLDTDGESDEVEPSLAVSSVLEYYTEAALTSKKRNALPDEVFGLPRIRAYPLNDKAHVKQAIRMFGHCKDPEDRTTLAKNIFAAMEKFKISTKIGKTNALYEYAPEALRESSELPVFKIEGLGTPISKRTKKDVVEEHMRLNQSYYNNIFYGPEFSKSIRALKEFQFFQYFWPDLKHMSFSARLECVCGGMAGGESAQTVYKNLGLRPPLCMDLSVPLGWKNMTEPSDRNDVSYALYQAEYNADSNWYHVDLGDDYQHMFYCLRLYSIMGEILLNPNFNPETDLTEAHYAVLSDWGQMVMYHYDLYREADADENSEEQLRQMQYLWDLFWCFTDSPYSEDDISVNIITILYHMASVRDKVINMNEANVPGELVTKSQCSAYLVHDLGLPTSMFLLPTTMEYPIINKASVRMAMDMIRQIPDDLKDEYTTNLNRMYKELGCTFSISVDHPYAPYADKNIIDHMTMTLLEGDTAVADDGTSVGKSDRVTQPWYKRLDYVHGIDHSVLDDAELGPNTKKQQVPEITPYESFL